ncbi:hypothetical protein JXA63_03620 [Candidatus Woesebacteria bacterium]|nr:hypothetical protein [Candidatus Woesebacteria bacterium]
MKNFIKLTYPALFIFASVVFILHYIAAGQAVYGDGIGYWAHLHSWVFDGDWDNTNEFKHFYSPQNNNSDNPKVAKIGFTQTSETEEVVNHFSPGMAFLLLPFYLTAHFIANLGQLFGLSLHPNGYSDIYQITSGIGAIVYTFIGLRFLELLIQKFTKSKTVARITVVGLFLTTTLFYYGSYNVLNSHFASFFLTTAFFYILVFFKYDSKKPFLLGLITGLSTANRPQDGLVAEIYAIYLLKNHDIKKDFSIIVKNMLSFTLGFLITVSLLVVQIHANSGSLSSYKYIQEFTQTFTGERGVSILGSLIDPMNGLFTKTPILIPIFFYYFYLLYKRNSNIYYNLAFIFFAGQIVIITLQRGWPAAAYGGRMYISSFIFFGLIFGELVKVFRNKLGYKFLIITISGFILLNFYNVFRFTFYDKQASANGSGIEGYTVKRIDSLLKSSRFYKLFK